MASRRTRQTVLLESDLALRLLHLSNRDFDGVVRNFAHNHVNFAGDLVPYASVCNRPRSGHCPGGSSRETSVVTVGLLVASPVPLIPTVVSHMFLVVALRDMPCSGTDEGITTCVSVVFCVSGDGSKDATVKGSVVGVRVVTVVYHGVEGWWVVVESKGGGRVGGCKEERGERSAGPFISFVRLGDRHLLSKSA